MVNFEKKVASAKPSTSSVAKTLPEDYGGERKRLAEFEQAKKDAEAAKAAGPAKPSGKDETFLPHLNIADGQRVTVRIVRLPDESETYNNCKIHFFREVDHERIALNRLKSVRCAGDGWNENTGFDCKGHLVHDFLNWLRSDFPFGSVENQKYFKMRNDAEPNEKVECVVIVIDKDGKRSLAMWTTHPSNHEVVLEMGSGKWGSPAHPVTGYEINITRKKNAYNIQKHDDGARELTEEEVALVGACKFTWSKLKNLETREYHAQLPIKILTWEDAQKAKSAAANAASAGDTRADTPPTDGSNPTDFAPEGGVAVTEEDIPF